MASRLFDMLARPLAQPLTRPVFWGRFAQYQLGVLLLGLGIAVMLAAGVGLGPWGVFHEGLSEISGLSFGRVLQLVGLVVIAIAWSLTDERPGPGTVMNMLLVGPWVDFFGNRAWMPAAETLVPGLGQFAVGTVIVGLASGLYITARFGAGPRDGLVLGLSDLFSRSVRVTRTGLEFAVLGLGFLLGGTVGWGTLVFAVLVGPCMQGSLRLFRMLERREGNAPS